MNHRASRGVGFYVIAGDGFLHKASAVQHHGCKMLCGKVVEAEVAVFEEPGSDEADATWFEAYRRHHTCPDCQAAGYFKS